MKLGAAFVAIFIGGLASCGKDDDSPPPAAKIANGLACAKDDDCLSGACEVASGSCGTCIARKTSGPCYAKTACADGYYCQFTDTSPGQCTPKVAEGQPCEVPSGNCSYCSVTLECADGLACMGAARTCTKTLTEGQTGCDQPRGVGCAKGLRCVAGTCTTLGKLGEACESRGDVETCAEGLFCPPEQTCAAKGVRKPGEPCRSYLECDHGFCANTVRSVEPGATVTVVGPGTCVALIAEGAACDTGAYQNVDANICASPATCTEGTCRSPVCK